MRCLLRAEIDGKGISYRVKIIVILLLITFCVNILVKQAVPASEDWELLYHQDFEAPADEWSSLEREGLACNYIEGEYEVELKCWSVLARGPCRLMCHWKISRWKLNSDF